MCLFYLYDIQNIGKGKLNGVIIGNLIYSNNV